MNFDETETNLTLGLINGKYSICTELFQMVVKILPKIGSYISTVCIMEIELDDTIFSVMNKFDEYCATGYSLILPETFVENMEHNYFRFFFNHFEESRLKFC